MPHGGSQKGDKAEYVWFSVWDAWICAAKELKLWSFVSYKLSDHFNLLEMFN